MRERSTIFILLKQPLTIWQAHLRSLKNIRRADSRLRIGAGISLVFSLALGLWSSIQLWRTIQQWQAQGPAAINMGLWLLCLGIWGGLGSITLLSAPNMLVNDEALLLLTLPIKPAARFRALLGSFFITNLWLPGLLQVLVTSGILLAALGWKGIIWIALLQLGNIVTVAALLVVVLLIVCYVLPREQARIRWLLVVAGGISALLSGIYYPSLFTIIHEIASSFKPEYALLLLVMLLMLLIGPSAERSGHLYQKAALLTRSKDRSRKALTLPGVQLLQNLFSQRRTLTGAIFNRSIVNQSRNWFFWGRLVITWSFLGLFPLLQTKMSQAGFSAPTLIVSYASLLAIGHILETAPGAFSGEASRLALYLIAPLEFAHILRAKLAVFLLPTLAEALALGLLLSRWEGLTPAQIGEVVVLIPLLVLPGTAILVWGSLWDVDLHQSVEGFAALVLLEEGPFSPRKMLLFNLCLAYLAITILLLWYLPGSLAFSLLLLLNVLSIFSLYRGGISHMHQLLRRG